MKMHMQKFTLTATTAVGLTIQADAATSVQYTFLDGSRDA